MPHLLIFSVAILSLLPLTRALSGSLQNFWDQKGKVVTADQYPGNDLGAKINAADRALGTNAGEIVVKRGGTISTQIVLSSGHTLRLSNGTYTTTTNSVPILLKSGSSVVGAGWDAVITESPAPGQFTVISAYNHAQRNGNADDNLLIRDVQIKGANGGFGSVLQAISLGNCSNCTVDKVWVNGTHSIGIQIGGSSALGHFAENSKVTNCQFTRVASQNLALVNGRNILFEGNKFLGPGQSGGPGSTTIDLEVNEAADHLEKVFIRGNMIDARTSELTPAGNGIVVQATTGTPHIGQIQIEGNTIIGGSIEGVITNKLSNGVYVFGATMSDVTVRNNTIRRTGQAGINLAGTRLTVMDNQLTDVGGGGIPGFIVENATNSRIIGNTFTYSGAGPVDNRIVISGASKGNTIQNNRGFNLADTSK